MTPDWVRHASSWSISELVSCYVACQSVTTYRSDSGSEPCLCQQFGSGMREAKEGGEGGVKRGTGGGDGRRREGGRKGLWLD